VRPQRIAPPGTTLVPPDCGLPDLHRHTRLALVAADHEKKAGSTTTHRASAPPLAFYTLRSLAPILLVVVAIAALAFGQKAAQGQLIWEIQDLVGREGARAIQDLIQSAYKPATGKMATVTRSRLADSIRRGTWR